MRTADIKRARSPSAEQTQGKAMRTSEENPPPDHASGADSMDMDDMQDQEKSDVPQGERPTSPKDNGDKCSIISISSSEDEPDHLVSVDNNGFWLCVPLRNLPLTKDLDVKITFQNLVRKKSAAKACQTQKVPAKEPVPSIPTKRPTPRLLSHAIKGQPLYAQCDHIKQPPLKHHLEQIINDMQAQLPNTAASTSGKTAASATTLNSYLVVVLEENPAIFFNPSDDFFNMIVNDSVSVYMVCQSLDVAVEWFVKNIYLV
ncbi:hypothetical protein EWM64_g5543 [Hericium alpestre]|uniref:Uncharacterized protein n=1 Tax=Hericium alpestre TaxID=135208 RepID=A0A4Y9ZWQ1_9AGAM|nr:hypothetical protein EWM64_g5543 [Hericium alpestre]